MNSFLKPGSGVQRLAALLWVAIAWAAAAGCGREPVVVPSRTLDRPTDLAFLCMRSTVTPVGSRNLVSAKPMSVCTAPLAAGDSREPLSPSRTLGLMGLITNSARGELAAVDFDRNRMVDLDPAIPGFNMLPVGRLPEAVAVSSDGCKAVSANRGSCDLSLVDTSRLLAGVFPFADPVTGTGAVATRLTILTDSGPLRSRPGEISFVPEATSAASSCQLAGSTVNGITRPWRAVVTFPSCGLVGLVELPSGRLLNSVYVRETGIEAAGTNPQCPVDCGNNDLETPVPDAGALSDAGDPDAGVGGGTGLTAGRIAVEALTFLPFVAATSQELYVAARNADVVVPFRVTDAGDMVSERAPLRLAANAHGVFRLRPSIEPLAAVDTLRTAFVGKLGNFLYALAGDNTVRVIDISAATAGAAEVECDANVDSLVLASQPGLSRGCIPVSAGLPRRLTAKGPGIQVPPLAAGADLQPPHPVDVTFFWARAASRPNETVGRAYSGAFAYILLSNGDILVVNIDSDQEVVLAPGANGARLPFAHTLRNALSFVELDKGGKRPRVASVPSSSLSSNELPFAVRAGLTRETIPRVQGFPGTKDSYCSPEASEATPATIYACFDRPEETVPQTWAVVWEGSLASRVTGRLANRGSSAVPGTVGVWEDPGADHCAAGVETGDIVRMIGCNIDGDCGDPKDFTCVPSVAGAPGLCARKGDAAAFAANPECQRLLRSRRRYEVSYAANKELGLALKLQELPKTSLRTCAVDADCAAGGPGFVCTEPFAGQGKRCVVPCDTSCAEGFTCEAAGDPVGRFCVEAPLPNPFCLLETSVYRVQAGKSFVVEGSFTRSFATTADVNGQCQPLQSRDPRFAKRIPLAAPRCSNIAVPDPLSRVADTAQVLKQSPTTAAGFPNPCLFEGVNGDDLPGTDPAFKDSFHVKALFEGPEGRFVLTNLEQAFGDGVIIQFSVKGGFRPDQVVTNVQPQIAIPTLMITGPTVVPSTKGDDPASPARYPYVYIVDSGRLGTEQHGQVLRLDTRRAAYDISVSKQPFQIR